MADPHKRPRLLMVSNKSKEYQPVFRADLGKSEPVPVHRGGQYFALEY